MLVPSMVPSQPMKISDGANQLREFLDAHGLSSRDIASRLSPRTEYQAVVRWYNGRRHPSGDYKKQLANLTGIPELAWLSEDERRVADAKARWMAIHPEQAATRENRIAPVHRGGGRPRGSVSRKKPGPKPRKKSAVATSKASRKNRKNRATVQTKPNVHTNHGRENSSNKSRVARDKSGNSPSSPPAKTEQPKASKANGQNSQKPTAALVIQAPPKRKSHSQCTSDDPMERVRKTRPDKYELVDKAGVVLAVYSNVVDAKCDLDLRDPHVTATAVQCRDCMTIMAQRSKPVEESTEFLSRSGI